MHEIARLFLNYKSIHYCLLCLFRKVTYVTDKTGKRKYEKHFLLILSILNGFESNLTTLTKYFIHTLDFQKHMITETEHFILYHDSPKTAGFASYFIFHIN